MTTPLQLPAGKAAPVSSQVTQMACKSQATCQLRLAAPAIVSPRTTRIAMGAAAEGIELTTLEVAATSRSDTRGLLGMSGEDGEQVCAGPCDVELRVRISAPGVSPAHLRELVEQSCRCSPIPAAHQNATPLGLQIEVDA